MVCGRENLRGVGGLRWPRRKWVCARLRGAGLKVAGSRAAPSPPRVRPRAWSQDKMAVTRAYLLRTTLDCRHRTRPQLRWLAAESSRSRAWVVNSPRSKRLDAFPWSKHHLHPVICIVRSKSFVEEVSYLALGFMSVSCSLNILQFIFKINIFLLN